MTTTENIDIGLQFLRNKQYDNAIKEFSSRLSRDQTYADGYFYRGCACLHLGQYEKAIDDFSLAIPSKNLSSKPEILVFYKRGYAYYRTNQLDLALDDYRHYIQQCEKNETHGSLLHKGFFQVGIIHAALNDHNSAISNFTNAIDSSQGTEEDRLKLYYLHRGRAYACAAKYDEAQADLYLVLEQSDDSFIKGCAYNELGQHQTALTEFNKLLQSNGNQSRLVQECHDHILFRQGLSCAALQLHDQALNHFESALNHSKRPSSSNITDRILFRKGVSNMESNRQHKALVDFNESTELNKNQSDVFYARGMLHYKLGRHDAAVFDQRQALELERKSLSIPTIYQTIYHTDKHADNYIYYENKIHEAEELLEKYKDTPYEPDIQYRKARYFQKQAPNSDDPQRAYESARGAIKSANKDSNKSARDAIKSPNKDSSKSSIRCDITIAINSYLTACYLAEKYSIQEMPETAIEQYIDRTVESILDMSHLFDKCIQKKTKWDELIKILKNELNTVNQQRSCKTDGIFIIYINNQLEKIDIIKKKMELFADSPVQEEFYGLLLNRLWNLFDGVRAASTGIFPNQLQGTCTKVSWVFKLLGKLCEFAPIGSEYGTKLFGICESGLKKIDETRIENALNHLGRRCNPVIANQIADGIATEITQMYENQLNRFLSTLEEEKSAADDNNNQQKKPPTVCSKCASCFSRCCSCCKEKKALILNEMDLSTIETIVEYAASLAVSCVTRFEVRNTRTPERIQTMFISYICRPSKITAFHIMGLADKIKPKDAKNDKEYWDTYDFFHRPAIDFENGTIRARKETDLAKYGCRKPTFEERQLLKTNTEELDKRGFKVNTVKNELS